MLEYTAEDWLNVPKGARNGLKGGIKFLLDVEMFDFTYTGKEFAGFKIGFVDPRDKATIKQDGYFISSGKEKCSENHFNLTGQNCIGNI